MSRPAMTTANTLPEAGLRHRITFATDRALAYVSVIELGAVWERALRRAHVPVKYSQGYNPRPRMHFAAPLPVGCGTEADLLDVLLDEPWTPEVLAAALGGSTAPGDLLPADLHVVRIDLVDEGEPALSEQLVAAEYRVLLRGVDRAALTTGVDRFVAAETVELPRRGGRHRGEPYNLRELVDALALEPPAEDDWLTLTMHVSARPGATGRPDEVLKALGVPEAHQRCYRTRLILAPSPA